MLYSFMVFVHILSVLGLVSASVMIHYGIERMRRASTVADVRTWSTVADHAEKAMPFVGTGILLSGLVMHYLAWTWFTAWIDISLLLTLVLTAFGTAVLSQRIKATRRAAEATTELQIPASLAAQVADSLLHVGGNFSSSLILALIFAMVFKPDLVTMLVAVLIIGLAGIAVSYVGSSKKSAVATVAHE